MTFDLELITRIENLRDAERMFRKTGEYDRADAVRQLADAYELRGTDILRCEFPGAVFARAYRTTK